ncbi:MAG TPA: hypothetical protein PK349_02760 [Candidatus Hydrogenedentes bacterium]|nr:hypothetical protein [Candidatus Hydrogenedentota bacterium]
MQHTRSLTRRPARAQDLGTGAILKVISQILQVIGSYLSGKEATTT